MKKILTLIFAVSMALCCVAQPLENDYTYSFWSNWSVGVAPMVTKSFNNNWHLGQGLNIGFDIRAEKQLTNYWQFRIIGDMPGIFKSETNQFDRYGKALVGFAWYPWQKHFYLFADGGAAFMNERFGKIALGADFGLGLNFNIAEHSSVFGELGLDCIADITSDFSHCNGFVKIGYAYRFGLTKTDRLLLEQRKEVNEETYQVIIMLLKDTVSTQRMAEQELVERIAELEQEDSVILYEYDSLLRENDSLKHVIGSFSENQTNFYALPFSVLFDNDSYAINASELGKIKAVASIMKDDTNVNYTVTGFCDYTGSQEYNQKLSEKRAEAVKKQLVKYGVKEKQLSVSGNGKDKPFSNGKLGVNRRVSFYRNLK